MFRGRPQRGGYSREFHPHGPPAGPSGRGPNLNHSPPEPGHPFHHGSYRGDRDEGRIPYHHGYREHLEEYRRSTGGRRSSPPGTGSNRGPGGEFRSGPPSRDNFSKEVSLSPPRGGLPVDHNPAVGNEQSAFSTRKSDHPYDSDYKSRDQHYRPPFPEKRPTYDPRFEDLGYRRRSLSRGRSRARSCHLGRERSRTPDSRSRSRGRSRRHSRSRQRSYSHERSRGRSRSRPRSRSVHRSKSCTRGSSRSRSGSSTRSTSSSRSSSSSCYRRRTSSTPPSKDRGGDVFRELELARRRKEMEEMLAMPKKSILKKRIDCEADSPAVREGSDSPADRAVEPQGSSLSRETERFLRVVTKGMESGLFASILGEQKEEMGKESCEAHAEGTTQSSGLRGHKEEFTSVKQETHADSTSEFLLPHEKVRQDSCGFSRILGLMGDSLSMQERRKNFMDIEDEERFLYGDEEENALPQTQPPSRQHSQSEMIQRVGSKAELQQYCDGKVGKPQYSDNPEYMHLYLSQAGVGKGLPGQSCLTAVGSQFCHNSSDVEANTTKSSHEQNQADTRYRHHSQHGGTPEKEGKPVFSEHAEAASYPPGLDPQEAKERQEVEEYEKIQDLLKTIGLDLGVAEISKMAARTQERLHGKKALVQSSRTAKKLPDRRVSCGSWDRNRSRSRSRSLSGSRSRTPSWSRSRGHRTSTNERSPSPNPDHRTSYSDTHAASDRPHKELEGGERYWGIPVLERSTSQPSVTLSLSHCPPSVPHTMDPLGALPSHPVPTYSQSPVPSYPPPPLVPSYTPPGYGQYGNYMSYMPPRWPMCPPPPLVPPAAPVESQKIPAASGRSNLRVIETVAIDTQNKGLAPKTQDCKLLQESTKASEGNTLAARGRPLVSGGHTARELEENNMNEKQKVIEEREKLKKEMEIRLKKKDYLLKELERLRKQQGELLRKKRREKDGHKDPLLAEVARLQEEVMAQISHIRKEQEAAKQKSTELDKVALILGLHVTDKHRRESCVMEELELSSERAPDGGWSSERLAVCHSSPAASSKASTSRNSPEKQKMKMPVKSNSPTVLEEPCEYYDAGDHWCKSCNVVCGSLFDLFTHLHSKLHRKDPYDRPWASDHPSSQKKRVVTGKSAKPAKGSEFLIPVVGFYCQLCEEFFGDQLCAEEHVSSPHHNLKYKKHTENFPVYEQRRNVDRQAGLSAASQSRERRHSKLKNRLEEKPMSEKGQHRKDEMPVNDRDEKSDRHRDDRSTGHREDSAGSHRDEKLGSDMDDRSTGHREDNTGGHRDGVDHRKDKWEKEMEGRDQTQSTDKKAEAASKAAQLAEKAPDIQKVISGPSPSILAKVRKRNEEANKSSSSSSSPPAFGKFSWKKVNKKEEEEKAGESPMEVDGSADSVGEKEEGKAVVGKPKTIAIKLSGKTVIPPSSPWVPSSISVAVATKMPRPNLPVPAMVLRKSVPGGSVKPAPLNSFLSIKPNNNGGNSKPLPVVKDQVKQEAVVTPDLISKAFCGEEVVLKTGEAPKKPTATDTKVSTEMPNTSSAVGTKAPSDVQTEVDREPASPPPPGTCVMSFESDVAVPGVPESEQTLTVVVRPPPLLQKNLGDTSTKTEKPKSSLAAAKAQDLYDIFYCSGGGKMGPDLWATPRDASKGKAVDAWTGRAEDRKEAEPQTAPASSGDPDGQPKKASSVSPCLRGHLPEVAGTVSETLTLDN